MNGHKIETGYLAVVSKGKVKASTKNNEKTSDSKEVKLNGYRFFLRSKQAEIKTLNPEASPQEIMTILNAEWNKEKVDGRKDVVYWLLQWSPR